MIALDSDSGNRLMDPWVATFLTKLAEMFPSLSSLAFGQ